MIEVKELTRLFGSHVALSNLTFDAAPGSVVGLLGRNGAGKSTCLRILAGTLRATSGSVLISGVDPQAHAEKARSKVGYLPESAPLYPELRVEEYLAFRAELKGVPRAKRQTRVGEVLALVNAEDMRHVRILHLSRGYQKRVGLADVLLADPEVLLLDEPTAGLDPTQNRDTRKLISTLGQSRTVLLSTHILSEVEAMCGRAIVIEQGKLVAHGTLAELRALRESRELEVEVRVDNDVTLTQTLSKLDCPYRINPLSACCFQVVVTLPECADVGLFSEQIAHSFTQSGLHLRALNSKVANLEQVFAALTEGSATP